MKFLIDNRLDIFKGVTIAFVIMLMVCTQPILPVEFRNHIVMWNFGVVSVLGLMIIIYEMWLLFQPVSNDQK